MTSVRRLQRMWKDRQYARLLAELLAGRPEASGAWSLRLANPSAVAALLLIRLDELNQTHQDLFEQLTRALVAEQQADGGWQDPATTALALRALSLDGGQGLCLDQGLDYLANLQKNEGIWPETPIRRLPGDPAVSAFLLLQLGHLEHFRQAVRWSDALNWFRRHEPSLDVEARRLWRHVALRHGRQPIPQARTSLQGAFWS